MESELRLVKLEKTPFGKTINPFPSKLMIKVINIKKCQFYKQFNDIIVLVVIFKAETSNETFNQHKIGKSP